MVIRNLGDKGYSDLQEKNNLVSAIASFRKAEVILDLCTQKRVEVSIFLPFYIIINMGIAFYKAGLLDEAYSCFETSDIKIREIESQIREQQQQDINVKNIISTHQSINLNAVDGNDKSKVLMQQQ